MYVMHRACRRVTLKVLAGSALCMRTKIMLSPCTSYLKYRPCTIHFHVACPPRNFTKKPGCSQMLDPILRQYHNTMVFNVSTILTLDTPDEYSFAKSKARYRTIVSQKDICVTSHLLVPSAEQRVYLMTKSSHHNGINLW